MKSAHVPKAPVVRLTDADTILKTAAEEGSDEIDVLRTDIFELGDSVTIDEGTASEETVMVTGFGSLIVDPVLQHAHAIGAPVVLSSDCPAECGDATGDDKVNAVDALAALKAAVGQRSCATCVCDANGNGSVTASDALAILRFAVGSLGVLSCGG